MQRRPAVRTGIPAWSLLLLLLLSAPAQAYVDPVTSKTALHVLSAVFIILSAGFVFFRNLILGFFRNLGRLVRRRRP